MKFCIDTGATEPLEYENSPELLQLTDSHYFSSDFLRLKINIAIYLAAVARMNSAVPTSCAARFNLAEGDRWSDRD